MCFVQQMNVNRLAGKQTDLGSNPLRLSFLFKSCGLWTLSCDFVPHNYETLKWLSPLTILMQGSFWWWQCSDRYIISLSPHLHTPLSPYLQQMNMYHYLTSPYSRIAHASLFAYPHPTPLPSPFSIFPSSLSVSRFSLSLLPHPSTRFSPSLV